LADSLVANMALLDTCQKDPHAVRELRRLLDNFGPYVAFYRQRWRDPANSALQDTFV